MCIRVGNKSRGTAAMWRLEDRYVGVRFPKEERDIVLCIV
jgi:hypothetical protein